MASLLIRLSQAKSLKSSIAVFFNLSLYFPLGSFLSEHLRWAISFSSENNSCTLKCHLYKDYTILNNIFGSQGASLCSRSCITDTRACNMLYCVSFPFWPLRKLYPLFLMCTPGCTRTGHFAFFVYDHQRLGQ